MQFGVLDGRAAQPGVVPKTTDHPANDVPRELHNAERTHALRIKLCRSVGRAARGQALIAFTRTAAYSEFVEDRLGTLEVGKLADLAVLSQDIFKVSNDDLPKTESVLTIVGGKIAYSREPIQ